MKRWLVVLFVLLCATAQAQQYVVDNFGGPVAPGIHAALQKPGMFTYSENMIVHQGTRVTRYGITKALGDTLYGAPFTALHAFRSSDDSLALLMFVRGKWYYTYYGAYTYTGSNWREKGLYYAPGYISADTFNVPSEIYPFTDGYTVAVATTNDWVGRSNPADITMWMALVEPGDSVYIDTSAGGTGKWTFASTVDYVQMDDRIMLVDTPAFSYSGPLQLRRPFDSAAVPQALTVLNDVYVTNGVDPTHRIYDSLGTLYMQEADLAYAGRITDVEMFFSDSVSDFQSYTAYDASVRQMRSRYIRIYDHNASWSTGEWSGGADARLSTMYFCRLGWYSDELKGDGEVGMIAPIIYNDANSLILLAPYSGDSTYELTVAPYDNFYPYYDTTANGDVDTASFHAALRTDLKDEGYYIFSAAGKFETVVANSATDSLIRTKMGGAMFWVLGQNTDLLFDDDDFNDGTYFLHLLDRPQVRNVYRSDDSVMYRTVTVRRDNAPSIPSDWQFVDSYTKREQSAGPRGGPNNAPRGYDPGRGMVLVWYDVYRVPLAPADLVDWPNFEYWPIRFIKRNGDTSFIITSIPPDTSTTAVITSKDWEIVRMRLPRFAGLARNADNTVFGWGDKESPALVSRSVNSPLRGGEPMNWNAAGDFVVTPTGEPIVYVAAYDDMELLFCEHSIWGAGIFANGFQVLEISRNIGLVAPRSVVVYGKRVFFEAEDGYYSISRRSLTGYDVVKVSAQMDDVLNPSKRFGNYGHDGTRRRINPDRKSLVHATYSPLDERIWLFYPDDTSSVPNYSMTLDPETGLWDGFHNVGATHAITMRMRDTMKILGAAPDAGMLAWISDGESDSGQEIRSVVEGAVFNIGSDSLWATPTSAWLTLSADDYNAGSSDSLYLRLTTLPLGISHSDSLVRLSAYANYTYTRPFYFHDAGSGRYWYWQLEYVSDVASNRRWFQPVRMTINFRIDKVGQ